MNIKAAIYDMDGTLVDSLMLWDRLWDHFGARYRNGEPFRPEPEDDKFVRTVPLKSAMERIHDRYGFGSSAELLREAEDLMRRFYAHEVRLKDGVKDSLAALQTAAGVGLRTVGIYDRFNHGQDRIKDLVTEYIAPGETLARLIK